MDMMTLAMAKSYTDSQRLAYDNSKVITWDGDITDKPTGWFTNLHKVMDDVLDLESITRVVLSVYDGSTVEFTDFTIDRREEQFGLLTLTPQQGAPDLVQISDGSYSPDIPKGTYLLGNSAQMWISRVECADIKTIEPKFLPGVCLPVWDIGELPSYGNSRDFTAEENARMDALVETKMPFILKGTTDYGEFCCVMSYSKYYNDIEYKYIATAGYNLHIAIRNIEGGWYISCNVSPNV